MNTDPFCIQPGDPLIGCSPAAKFVAANGGIPGVTLHPVDSPQTAAAAPYVLGKVTDAAGNSYTVFMLPGTTPLAVAGDMLWPGSGITQAAVDELAKWNIPVARVIAEGVDSVPSVVIAPETGTEPVPDPTLYGEVA